MRRRPTAARDTGGVNASPSTPARGRPRASSRAVLEEAASELFLEQGYGRTSVDQIARRAGVSRGTFFNYFASKADVFWGDVDAQLDRLPELLSASNASPAAAIDRALADLATSFGPDRVPWILSHFEAIGSPDEVLAAATRRATRAAETLRAFVAERTGGLPQDLGVALTVNTALALALAAMQSWIAAGPTRGGLDEHLARANALRGEAP